MYECVHGCVSITGDEAVLKSLCWIPFGVQTLPIESRDVHDTLYLQPPSDELGGKKEDTIYVEVPPNAVSTSANVEMRYAIIPRGSFTLPEGYQFGSPAVYIYYDGRRVTKPLKLHLPHWYGGRNPIRDGLSFAISPHYLKKGKRTYHFEVIKGGTFSLHQQYGTFDIDGHSTLFAEVYKEKATSVYLMTQLEKRLASKTHTRIVITHCSTVWLEVRCVVNLFYCMIMHSLSLPLSPFPLLFLSPLPSVHVCVCVCVHACVHACVCALIDSGKVLADLGNYQGHFCCSI